MAAGGTQGAISRACGISAATVVKASPGRLCHVHVLVAGSTLGSVNDCATTGAAAVTNQVAAVPNAVGYYDFECPLNSGLTVTPGTGQVLTVTYW